MHVVRATTDNAKGTVPGETVNRMTVRRFIEGQSNFPSVEMEYSVGHPPRPRKQQRNTAPERMRMPHVEVGWAGDYFQRCDAIVKALASGFGNDRRALAMSFEGDEIHPA